MSCLNMTEQYGVFTYFLVCGCLTVFLNAVVLFIALMYIDLHKKPNQILVVCMTGADLCFGLCFTVTRPFISCAPTWFCGPYYIILWACQLGSTAFLLLLNVDKLIRIVWPLNYRSIATFHRITLASTLVWVVILLFAIGSFVEPFMKYSEFEDCVQIAKFIPAIYYAFMTLFGYATPTLLSMTISVAIYVFAYRASHSYIRRSSMHSTRAMTRRSSSVRRHRKIMMKRILFVFSSTLWTTVTFLPYRVALMVYTFCALSLSTQSNDNAQFATPSYNPNISFIISRAVPLTNSSSPLPAVHVSYGADATDSCAGQFVYTLINVLLYLLILGSLGNPIVTVITQNTYKNRLLNFWAVCAGRCRLPHTAVIGRQQLSVNDYDEHTTSRTDTITLSTLAGSSHKNSAPYRVVGFFRKKSAQEKQRRAKSLNSPRPPAFDPEMFLEEKETSDMMEMTPTPVVKHSQDQGQGYQTRRYRLKRHAQSTNANGAGHSDY